MNYLKTILFTFLAGFAFVAGAQGLPQIITGETTNRDVTEVRVNAEVRFTNAIPFGQVYFEYGRTGLYGARTPVRSVTESGPFSEIITGLNEETSYNYRAVLSASDGTVLYGSNNTFITKRFSDPRDLPDPQDQDNETLLDPNEQDSDGDGIPDEIECPGKSEGAACPDTDGDGFPDYLDPDSDNDGILDRDEEEGQRLNQNPNTQTPEGSQGTGVTVGVPSTTGGGSLIPNGSVDTLPTGSIDTGIPESSGGIVNCGRPTDDIRTPDVNESDPCEFNEFIGLINSIINWIVGISVFIATAALVYGGILYMVDGGKATQVGKAKKIWKSVGYGLFFVLAAWLMIDFIMDKLVEPSFLQESDFFEDNGTQ